MGEENSIPTDRIGLEKNSISTDRINLIEEARQLYQADPHGPVTKACVSALKLGQLHQQLAKIGETPEERAFIQADLDIAQKDLLESDGIELDHDPSPSPLTGEEEVAFRVITATNPKARGRPYLPFDQAYRLAIKVKGWIVPLIHKNQPIQLIFPPPEGE